MSTETIPVKFHPNWMRVMYALTVVIAGGIGLALLIAPKATGSFLGYPTEEPLIAGIAYSVWFTLGILSIAGLRSPLKFAPVLIVEMTYKTVWILAVIIPTAMSGPLASFGLTSAVLYLIPIIGNLIVVPWRLIFAK